MSILPYVADPPLHLRCHMCAMPLDPKQKIASCPRQLHYSCLSCFEFLVQSSTDYAGRKLEDPEDFDEHQWRCDHGGVSCSLCLSVGMITRYTGDYIEEMCCRETYELYRESRREYRFFKDQE